MPRAEVSRPRLMVGIVLMAGSVLIAGCNILKLGSSPDDKAVTTQIQAKLFDDSVLKMRDIHVASDKGTVTLTGTVNTDLEKAAAERVAGRADGVKSVVNQLVVSPVSMAEQSGVTQPTQSVKPATPKPPAKTETQTGRWRPFRTQRQARSSSNNEAAAEQASVPETPADHPPEMAAQAAPPAPVVPPPSPAVPTPPVVKPPDQIAIPAGSFFSVRMNESIDSRRSRTGDEFAATLDVPVVVNNRVVLPRHSDARVRLVQATSAGRVSGRSELKVELVSVTAGEQTYPLETDYYDQAGASRNTRTAEAVGGGAVLGALIGAIAGRGRGAAVGSVAGAGTGAAVEARTHGDQVRIPSETKLSFTLKNPVTITLKPDTGVPPSNSNPGGGPALNSPPARRVSGATSQSGRRTSAFNSQSRRRPSALSRALTVFRHSGSSSAFQAG